MEKERTYSPLGQETDSCSTPSRMSESKGEGEAMPKKKRYCTAKNAVISILSGLLIVSVSFNIIQYAELNQLQTTPVLPNITKCLPNWIQNGEMCYFFSGTQMSWNFSQNNCSLYGASLLTLISQQERDFVEKHRRLAEYWLNLQRKNVDEPWKWPNGSLVDSRFYIGGKGLCAYLNEKAASSTFCDNDRYWICSKLISST